MKKSIIIFYILLFYALGQLISWGALVVKIDASRMPMIMGEGAVFLFLLGIGAYFIHASIKKEHRLKEQQQNFLMSITHELKSPLAAIKLSIQTIVKRDLDKARQISLLNNSLKDIERLDDLVENMLLATKIENRSYTFPKEEFNFSELVYKITDRLQVHSCGNEQLINAHIQPNLQLMGDKFALSSVVTNLIENAVKYTTPEMPISVSLEEQGHQAIIKVADLGAGIPDAEKQKVLEKFYRVGDESKRTTKGTGLGLYLSTKIVKDHKGSILIENNHPVGTVFKVILPKNRS